MGIEDRLKQWLAEVARGKPFLSSQIYRGEPRPTINKVLAKKTKAGELMRVARGIYVKPRIIALIGPVPPDAESIARAIVDAEGAEFSCDWRCLGQLLRPDHSVDLRPHRIQFGRKGRLVFLHSSTREIRLARFPAGRAILALEWTGRSDDPLFDIGKIQAPMTQDKFLRFVCESEAAGGWTAQAAHGFSSPG
jgi:hypothetical protein